MEDNELIHHGVKGMKWGVRRYQNEDGTLTEEGKKKYRNTDIMEAHRAYNKRWNRNSAIAGGVGLGVGALTGAIPVAAFGGPAAIPLIIGGLTGAQVAAGLKAASSIVGHNRLKRVKDLNDESLKIGRDTAADVVAIYGKQKIKS